MCNIALFFSIYIVLIVCFAVINYMGVPVALIRITYLLNALHSRHLEGVIHKCFDK